MRAALAALLSLLLGGCAAPPPAPNLTTTLVRAPGFGGVGGTGLRVTEGWGYMDQNILQVPMAGAGGGPAVVYAALFFPCNATNPNSTWLLYCATVWRSSDGAQSPTLRLGAVAGHTASEAYQPPMLFHHNGTLLIARWAQESSGSMVALSSLPCEWGQRPWRAEDAFAVPTGSLNYLGGAMDSQGGITVSGMLELAGPAKSTLGVVHATLRGGRWSWGALSHAGPIYESVDFQPLYPQLTHTKAGGLVILVTLNSDAPCPSSTRPGHINMGAMYRQLRLYRGVRSNGAWNFTELWRDLAPDAAAHPSVNGDPCLLYSERFPHDILDDSEKGRVLALYKADDQGSPNNTYPEVNTSWPLLAAHVHGVSPGAAAVETLSADLARAAFEGLGPGQIQAMQLTRVGGGLYLLAAASRDGGCNSTGCVGRLHLSTTADFITFADVPVNVEMPYWLGGNSVKLTQPNKNGGDELDGEAAFWWQGSMAPPSSMHFLAFSLARLRGLHAAKSDDEQVLFV